MTINEFIESLKDLNIEIGGYPTPRDLAVFCRQFVSMMRAGVTILDTLEMLSDQTENKTMAKAIKGVHGEIQKGENFSDAIAKYPKVFPSIMVSMITAGEASGKIDVAFERIWNKPNKYLPILGKFKGVITPDFSSFSIRLMVSWKILYSLHAFSLLRWR